MKNRNMKKIFVALVAFLALANVANAQNSEKLQSYESVIEELNKTAWTVQSADGKEKKFSLPSEECDFMWVWNYSDSSYSLTIINTTLSFQVNFNSEGEIDYASLSEVDGPIYKYETLFKYSVVIDGDIERRMTRSEQRKMLRRVNELALPVAKVVVDISKQVSEK